MTGDLFSVSVDLDGLGCYAAIHGQDPRALDERALRAVPEVALGRLCELFESLGVASTLFAIGSELSIPGASEAIARAAKAGHEIGSHSFAHDYALSRKSQEEIEQDLREAEGAITRACGQSPRGFRAPGYTLSKALLGAVRARGYLYDSSLLPSPPYYALKAMMMGLYALNRRPSRSILGAPGQLFARRGAHEREGVRELPVSTLPLVRGPVIGTVVLGVEPGTALTLSRWAFAAARGSSAGQSGSKIKHFNLELHGIDALDASDVPRSIAEVQPGVAVPAGEKLKRLKGLLVGLQERAQAVTLESAARALLG